MITNEGDKAKAAALFGKYGGTMLYISTSILHDKALAEDAVSEAFIRIIENLEKIDIENRYKTRGFIISIIRNISLNILKEQKRFIPLDELSDYTDGTDIILDNVSSREACEKIAEAIVGLNKNYSDILYLKLYMDYTYDEIAKILGISRENVVVRYNRAKTP